MAFLDRKHHLLPLENLFCFSLAQADHGPDIFRCTMLVFDFFDQHLNGLPDFRRWFVFVPFVLMDSTFAFEPYVDDYKFIVNFNDFAFDNLIDVELLICV